MSKILKRITAYTLAGAIVAGSFGSYNQVNSKEADTENIENTILNDNSPEFSYIIERR